MKRYQALDVFRGMTICLMIIVNTPGDWGKTFAPLLHADWHGFTVTDLVFPSFVFALGTSLAFVKRKWKNQSKGQIFGKILKRTFIIFILGFIMYWFPFMKWEGGEIVGFPISETRIWGVLQRIAICYGAAALLVYFLNPKQLIYSSAAILIGYWAVMWGFGDYSLEGNAARTLDVFLFGENHLYGGEGVPFDPEGLLSTFPAIINAIGGYLAGRYIIDNQADIFEKLTKLLLIGFGLITVAHFWDYLFPINKKIWTSSYVLLTIGLDLAILSGLIYMIDIKKQAKNFKFFEVFGKNPLFLYLFSVYLIITLLFIRPDGKTSLFDNIYSSLFTLFPEYWSSLAFAIVYMLLCWAVGWWLDRKKIYIKV